MYVIHVCALVTFVIWLTWVDATMTPGGAAALRSVDTLQQQYPFKVNRANVKTFQDIDVPAPKTECSKGDDSCANKWRPCEKQVCGHGRQCIEKDGGAICDCAEMCAPPGEWVPVCSTQNITFNNVCHLYRQRCLCNSGDWRCINDEYRNAHMLHITACKLRLPCDKADVEDIIEAIPGFLIEAMQGIKQYKQRAVDWVSKMEEEADENLRTIYPLLWKACDKEAKEDKVFLLEEILPTVTLSFHHQPCLKDVLERCDSNRDNRFTIREFENCLGVKLEEIVEHCFV